MQARLHLVFTTFAELSSANAVVRYLWRHHLPLPSRPLRGPSPQVTVWDEATLDAVIPAFNYFAFWYVLGAVAFWFIGFETRGRSLEEIDATLSAPAPSPARVPVGETR